MKEPLKTQLAKLRPLLKTSSGQQMRSELAGQLICVVEGKDDSATRFAAARSFVLGWAAKRWPKSITRQASDGADFESLPAPNVFIGACSIEAPRIWAARFHHPDAEVPARGWTVEVNVAEIGGAVVFGYRTIVSSSEGCEVPVPRTTPTFVRSLHGFYTLRDGLFALDGIQIQPTSCIDIKRLRAQLLHKDRTLPVVVMTPLPRRLAAHGEFIIDPDALAKRLVDRAHVVAIPHELLDDLIDEVGRNWSVYGGAVRLYWPGLQLESSSAEEHHPFFTPDAVIDWSADSKGVRGKEAFISWLEQICWNAQRSPRLRERFAGYSDVRARAMELSIARMTAAGDHKERAEALAKQMDSMQEDNKTLQELLIAAEEERDLAIKQHQAMEERLQAATIKANALEAQLNLAAVTRKGAPAEVSLPTSFDDIDAWCANRLKGKVHVLPRALREAKQSEFEDVPLLYNCLLMLGNEYRNMKLGGQDLRDVFAARCAELGAKVGRSAGETTWEKFSNDYKVPWGARGDKRILEHHLTAGGGRDERHYLRIYFFWDDEEKLVVVGWMPSHLPNSLT